MQYQDKFNLKKKKINLKNDFFKIPLEFFSLQCLGTSIGKSLHIFAPRNFVDLRPYSSFNLERRGRIFLFLVLTVVFKNSKIIFEWITNFSNDYFVHEWTHSFFSSIYQINLFLLTNFVQTTNSVYLSLR